MTRIFADSYFFFALLNPRDPAHAKAVDFSRQNRGPLATTAWVFTELADGLASTPRRQMFRRLAGQGKTTARRENTFNLAGIANVAGKF